MAKSWLTRGFFTLCLLSLLCVSVHANETGSVYVDYYYADDANPGKTIPIALAPWKLYYLAQHSSITGEYRANEAYESLGLDYLSHPQAWEDYKGTVTTFISQNALPADLRGSTDDRGSASIQDLLGGVYLLVFDSVTQDGMVYSSAPILLTLPGSDIPGSEWIQQVVPKVTQISGEESQTTHLLVMKTWRNDNSTEHRPESIWVSLYLGSRLQGDPVLLNAENSWSYCWYDLPVTNELYTVKEEDLPSGYQVTYHDESYGWEIRNTYSEDPEVGSGQGVGGGTGAENDDYDTDVESGLAQTGALVWPIPVLAGLSLGCLSLGLFLRRNRT